MATHPRDITSSQRTDLSRAKLIVLLARLTRSQIVTIYAETVPGMIVKDRQTGEPNPYLGRLKKQAKVNGVICFDYSQCVNAQRIRESDAITEEQLAAVEPFEPAYRTWGSKTSRRNNNGTARIGESCFVEYRGWLYLEIKVERRIEIRYTLDRKPVHDRKTIADIERYFYKRSRPKRQQLKRPVVLRDYGIETILGVQIGGQLLVVERPN